jgi:uncharacterized cupin superfamily protein
MKKLDLAAIPTESGCNYPAPYDTPCLGSTWKRLGKAGGLKDVGVNISRLPPGVWSSQRHWHSHEEELIYILEGEVSLVTDDGEETLFAGDCAVFPAGDPDGHHLINRSQRDVVLLEVGTRDLERDRCVYPDIDMIAVPGTRPYVRRDGTPYPAKDATTWLVGQAP